VRQQTETRAGGWPHPTVQKGGEQAQRYSNVEFRGHDERQQLKKRSTGLVCHH